MNKWIAAFRLRTLPLSLACILLGNFLAYRPHHFRWEIFFLTLICTVFLQILSNLANDFGDFKKGTDNENRLGPERTMQAGVIKEPEMKKAIILLTIFSLLSGVSLLLVSFKNGLGKDFWYMLGIGLLAIWAAIQYTVGKRAYGYAGLGDVFVFLFFGWVAVVGSFYLHHQVILWEILLPASAVGLLATAVLNLNNMRDIENDKANHKNTLPVKMGLKKAKNYHCALIFLPFVLASIFLYVLGFGFESYIFWIVFPKLYWDYQTIRIIENGKQFDPFLKKTAIATLLFSLTLGIGLILPLYA